MCVGVLGSCFVCVLCNSLLSVVLECGVWMESLAGVLSVVCGVCSHTTHSVTTLILTPTGLAN